jgi:hypothetical protein
MRNARFAGLAGRPISDEGRAVVEQLGEAIMEQEKRKYARRSTSAQFHKAIGAFTADLLLAQGHKSAKGWIHRSLRDESFDNGSVTRTQGKAVWKGLLAAGFIRHVQGYTRFGEHGHGNVQLYVSPKLCATAALLQVCEDCGVKAGDAKLHFTSGPPKDPVIVKATSTYENGRKFRGKVLRSKIPVLLQDEVREINSFLEGFTLEHGTHRGFFRGYNNGDARDFAFNKGGRLSSAGNDSYQNLPDTERWKMTIDDEPVHEVDVRASYMNILHAFHRSNFEGDPFIVPSLGPNSRGVVKMFVSATIGSGEPVSRWSPRHAKDFLKDTGAKLEQTWPLTRVAQATLLQHPLLTRLGEPVGGRAITWADLMWVESQAIVRTMLDLKRNYGIPSYPVHDSLIVPRSKSARTEKQLLAHYYGELAALHPTPTAPTLRIAPEGT